MSKLKVLFQEPFVPRSVTFGKFASAAGNNTFPHGLAAIASYIKERGYEVAYLDPNLTNMSSDEYVQYIKSGGFNVIGIGSTTLQIEYAISSFENIKNGFPNITTVLGGIHATLMPDDIFQSTSSIDYLVLGEGERAFHELLKGLEGKDVEMISKIEGICFKGNGTLVKNLPFFKNYLSAENIPTPLFEIFPMKQYIAQITFAKTFPSYSLLASRGCAFKCAFCNASDTLGKKVRYKPVDSAIREIRELRDIYGAKGVMFLDSIFTINKKWVKEFCIEYIKSDLSLPWACNSRVDTLDRELLSLMKEAGCWSVVFGMESGNQKSLDLMLKGCTVEQGTEAIKTCLEMGFYVYASYILCIPGETEEDAMNTIRYARSMGNHMALFYLPIPYPKTKLWELCKEMGGLREDAKWTDYNAWDYSNPVYVNPLIGKEKMQSLYSHSFRSFYSNPVVVYRNLKELMLLRQSPYKFWLGAKVVSNFLFK